MFKLKYIFAFMLIFIFLTPLFAQDKIIAIVNSDVITQKDLDDFISFTRVQLSRDYKGEALEKKIQSIKVDLLDKLIEDRLILQEAKKSSITMDENRIKARLAEIKKRYDSDAEFQSALSQQGMAQADLELRIREQFLMYTIVDDKIRSKIMVNPSEVTDFYQNNLKDLRLPESREFESLAFKDQDLAGEVVDKLKNGQKIEDLVKQYALNINKMSAMKNGQLRPDIEQVIFKLNLGQLSEPVKIEETFYIFQLDSIIPSRIPTLIEAQDKIYEFLFEAKLQEGLVKWLDELKKHSYIEILQG